MITEHEVPAYLLHELPEIIFEFKYMYPSADIYKTIQCLVNSTNCKVMQDNLDKVKECFTVAEKLYCNSNALIRNAIEKIFIHSIPVLMLIWNKNEEEQLHFIISLHLHTAYLQQKNRNI